MEGRGFVAVALTLAACGGLERSGLGPIDAGGPDASSTRQAGATREDGSTVGPADAPAAPGNGSDAATSGGDATSSPGAGQPDAAAAADSGAADAGGGSGDGPATALCGAGSTCYPAPPPGWDGPLELFAGASPASPACTGAFAASPAFTGHGGLAAPPAQCPACTCGRPTGTACSPVVELFGGGACDVPCATVTPAADAVTCTAIDVGACGAGGLRANVAQAQPVGGSCAPVSIGQALVPPFAWTETVLACAPARLSAQASCGAGAVCGPEPAPGFGPRPCVRQSGDVACPAGAYSTRAVFYSAAPIDTRGCSAFACGPTAGAQCGEAKVLFFDDACASKSGDLNAPAACEDNVSDQGPPTHLRLDKPVESTGGACAPTGSDPTGEVTAAGASTFCCLL